mmetsp:Transcript_46438/g.131312  ORF Transcript_46438/g.131312 Transcript_46438/m.131312 type:complete len:299 (-) Transcript_46438:207-1103(-)
MSFYYSPSLLHSGRHGRQGLIALATIEQCKLHNLAGEALHLLACQCRCIYGNLVEGILLLTLLGLVHHQGRCVDLLELLQAVLDHLVGEAAVVHEGRGGQGVNPVLAPQELEDRRVHRVLEYLDGQRVVPLAVDTEILDLVERDGLVLGWTLVRWHVALRVRAECTDVDLTRSAGANRIYDDGQEGLLVCLVGHLRLDVDAAQPAPIARVGVVPPAHVLLLPHLLTVLCEGHHELVGRRASVHSCLRALHRQRERVCDDEPAVRGHLSKHEAHDFVHLSQNSVARRSGVHHHLDEGHG